MPEKKEHAMYLVPLSPAEIWIGIAILLIVVAIVAIRKCETEPRRMTDEEYREYCEKRDRECREFFAQYKKDHPEIWDEDGNLR